MQTHKITMHNNNHNKNNIATITKHNNNNKNITTNPNTNIPRNHNSTTQACAACKYRRRKCASDCILAAYFPHDRQPQFLNAHRLFGVSNIVKIVGNLGPQERDIAMRTIIFQSDARAVDPVGGCHRIIRDLEHRISLAKAELEIVLHQLALCRAATQRQTGTAPLDGGDLCDDKWRVDDVDSWGCVNENLHAHAESISSSFPHHHERKLSMEECTNDLVTPILDHLVCDDDQRDEEFNFDYHDDIIPSNNGSLTERATFREEDECLSYIQDQDIKAAATFFSLTN